ncbi:hypothetical protein CK203_048857 [Vitis vinifera]|uniref:Protein JASON n=1 Tax=Vitis vinifera TaxID=29760 RepID=A0A438FKT0_VITVI|nr:hypothetical protein CK203_048857 [Vitis vinifera]
MGCFFACFGTSKHRKSKKSSNPIPSGVQAEIDEKEINSPMPKPVVACESKPGELKGNIRDRSQYVDSVLKPVENLSQWKTELDADHPKPVDEDTAVDASLSSWLVGLETTPNSRTSTVSVGNSPSEGAKSPRKQEDRPILGAMTVEELKQLSASSSPRRSPRRSPSPDEVPIIGTVGSYWSHTGQTMATAPSSCCQGILSTRGTYIEEKRVKWNSTQFERRLGRALDRGAAEV